MRYLVSHTRTLPLLLLALAGGMLGACGRGDAASDTRKVAPAAAIDLASVHADTPGAERLARLVAKELKRAGVRP